MSRLTIVIFISVLLSACGGGGSGSTSGGGGVVAVNILPTVNAGGDVQEEEQTQVTLTGTANDPDGTIQSYSWKQTAGSPTVTLKNADQASVTFISPYVEAVQTLTFTLTVTDNKGGASSDTVDVVVNPIVADYKLTDVLPTLYRYQIGNYLNYSISLQFRGNSTNPSSTNEGHYNVTYSTSTDPVTVNGSYQTMTKTYELKLPDSTGTETTQSTIQQQVLQFPASTGAPPSEWVFIEQRSGSEGTYGINNQIPDITKNNGEIFIPGQPSIGFSQDETYNNLRYQNSNATADNPQQTIQVTQKMTINGTHVIKTPLGNFEAYKMNWDYSETGPSGENTQSGVFWLYPPIGIIKAEYVESIGTVTPAAVSDITYTLEDTNIPTH